MQGMRRQLSPFDEFSLFLSMMSDEMEWNVLQAVSKVEQIMNVKGGGLLPGKTNDKGKKEDLLR